MELPTRWMVYFMENPSINGWWLRVPPFQETSKCGSICRWDLVGSCGILWHCQFWGLQGRCHLVKIWGLWWFWDTSKTHLQGHKTLPWSHRSKVGEWSSIHFLLGYTMLYRKDSHSGMEDHVLTMACMCFSFEARREGFLNGFLKGLHTWPSVTHKIVFSLVW